MITTPVTTDFPEIDWIIGDIMDYDPEERVEVFEAAGFDKEGNSYSGSAYYFAGKFEQIEGIEKL